MPQLVSYNCWCGFKADEEEYLPTAPALPVPSRQTGGQAGLNRWDGRCRNCGEKVQRYRIKYCEANELGVKANSCNIDSQSKPHPRWSWSMGVDVRDIPAMLKLYPDRVYHPKTGQLLVESRQHKKRLMKEHGLYEH